MHNLLLGTAKKVMTIWRDKQIISEKDLKQLQERLNAMKVPHTVGKIPQKIESKFTGFTAKQWSPNCISGNLVGRIVHANLRWHILRMHCTHICEKYCLLLSIRVVFYLGKLSK